MPSLQNKVTEAFKNQYGAAPSIVVQAPGRVNLIGEHTDYNDGFVLPMAIDRAVWMALRPRTDRQVVVTSLDMNATEAFNLDEFAHTDAGWFEYIKGVAAILTQRGYPLAGWEGVMAGNVPIGSGLSSSAALEMATARAFNALADWSWDAAKMALMGQAVENEWMGVNTGIMDQMISASGIADHALLIDCRSLDTEAVQLPEDVVVVVLDTVSRRGLVDSAYNERRSQCEAAAQFFGVELLRDVDEATFAAQEAELSDLARRRARHVITENGRVMRAIEAMKANDPVTLGKLMDASHESLDADFEVTSKELNAIVNCARAHDACYGARMTGAGFGGCAVALVRADAAEDFAAAVAPCYEAAVDLKPNIYVSKASAGASIVVQH